LFQIEVSKLLPENQISETFFEVILTVNSIKHY